MKCPCQDCDHRKWDCHGKCEAYIEWNKWNTERRNAQNEETRISYLASEKRKPAYRRRRK